MKRAFILKMQALAMILACCSIFICSSARATSISVSGTISANTVWSADTVKVTGNVIVNSGVLLTVNPGVKVIFQGHYRIDVQGRMLALGTTTQAVHFTISDTTGFSNMLQSNGGWGGIRIDSTLAANDSSKFAYCNFSFGKATGSGDFVHGGAIFIFNYSKVKIQNCNFSYCRATNDGGAIYVKSATALISNNTFYKCQATRGAGVFADNAYPRIDRNTFTQNYASSMGGCICVASSSAPVIINNLMYRNLAYLGGGIAFINGGGLTAVTNNTITNNRANYGGGISSIATDAKFINNILWDNEAAEGFQVTLLDPDSDPDFTYCDVQGGSAAFGGSGSGTNYSGIYSNNLNSYPLFADTLIYDYQIRTASPCIDAGKPDTSGLQLPALDIAGNPRINMSRVDIGAFERQQVVSYCGTITQNTVWNADTVKLSCNIVVAPTAVLTISPGVYVQSQGSYSITVNGRLQALGNATEPISFSAKNTTTGWTGIHFKHSGSLTDSSRMLFCNISYVKNLATLDYGALFIDSTSKISIKNCSIHHCSGNNGGAIVIENSSPLIAWSVLNNNNAHPSLGKGGAMYMSRNSSPRLRGLKIYLNDAWQGGGLFADLSNPDFENCLFSNNTSANHGAGIYSDSSILLIKNSLIVNNSGSAAGGGIYAYRSQMTINSSDIVNNQSSINAGGIDLSKSRMNANNSILYGNADATPSNIRELFIADTFCVANFKNCDVRGDSTAFTHNAGVDYEGNYISNLNILPGFIAPTAGPGGSFYGVNAVWMLDACSPLYNEGTPSLAGIITPTTDYAGNARVYADTIDIGAYELIKAYIAAQGHDTAVCAGNNAYFSITAESSVAANYQWQVKPFGSSSFVNATGPGAATSTYTVSAVTPSMNGDQYHCVVTSLCTNASTSNDYTLTVYSAPSISNQPAAVSVCQNTTANFSVTAGGSNLTYQWQQRPYGSSVWSNCTGTSATTANYSIPSVPPAINNYSYRCIINGSCDPGDTTVIVDLTVKSLPSVVTQPGNQSVCEGANASFTVSGSGTGISYLWQESTDGGTTWNNLTGQTTTTLNLTSVTIGMSGYKYRCVISGDCSPVANSNAAILTVNTPPQISSQPVNADACVYSDVSIPVTATGGNLTFQWQQKAPADVVWSNATGLSALTSTYQLLNVSLMMNGYKYRCMINGSCAPGTTSDSVVLHVYNLPGFYAGPDTSMLLSETIVLDAGPGFASYEWSSGELTQTVTVVGTTVGVGAHPYTCTVTDAHGCQNNDALIVTVIDDAGIPSTDNASVSISPNPAGNLITIRHSGNTDESAVINILDVNGRLIKSAPLNHDNAQTLDISDIPQGYYVLRISGEKINLVKALSIIR
jgi:predicted outer membrane repeat protein